MYLLFHIGKNGVLLHMFCIQFEPEELRDRSLFIGITGSGKFNWNFSRFS